jgi:hypothetical protein
MPTVGLTHHLKLGTEYLMVRPNTYQKRPAPTFGARIASGDSDYNNLSIWQHWVQKCWIGGMGADEWIDDAMYDATVGTDTTVHEEMRLSRRLVPSGTGSTLGGATDVIGFKFETFNDVLYCMVMTTGSTASRLYSYTPSTGAWASVSLPGGTFLLRAMASFDGQLLIGGVDGGAAKLYCTTAPGSWTSVVNPAGVTNGISSMRAYNSKLYVAYGAQIWRLKSLSAPTVVASTWDGTTVFYTANGSSSSNYIQAMETHLGFLYMLSQNGHLHRSDGNNTFDIWSWDGQTAGVSLRSYDGRLFVGTYEYSDTPEIGYGVLYQFTGSAVTELKRWGRAGKATTIGQMTVYNRRLFYGASSLFGVRGGFGIASYDSIEDGHTIWAIQDDVATYPDGSGVGIAWIVDDLIVFGGKLICAVRGHGVFSTESSFKDVAQGRARYTTSAQGGELISSLYDAGTPGMMKLWSHVTLYMGLPTSGQSFTFSYSLDGGATWVALATQVGPSTGDNRYVFPLDNKRSTRFKWKVNMRTNDETATPVLRGVVVAYLPQPEPGWLWSFTVPIADQWELLDGSLEDKDVNALTAYLEGLFRGQSLVQFTDVDGVVWAPDGPGVLLYDITIVHYDIESPREGDIRIVLLETVEDY